MAHIRSRQVMFLSMLLGGGVYTGKDIHAAHAEARGHGLSGVHFDLFLKHFRAALQDVESSRKMPRKSSNSERRRRAVLDR
jgi:truncated hemoglobin YjbI